MGCRPARTRLSPLRPALGRACATTAASTSPAQTSPIMDAPPARVIRGTYSSRHNTLLRGLVEPEQHTSVQMLYPTLPHHAEDRQPSPACPTPAAPRKPVGLRSDAIKMPSVINSRLSLDRDHQSGRSERNRIDIATTAPSQRMPQPPALRLQRCERALDGVLRARPDPTPASEREPVARVQTQPDGREEQQPAERRRARARDHQPEQPGDDASQRRPSGVREPAILLATRVVHAATASSSQPAPNALSHSVGSAIARSSHRCQTVLAASGIGPSYDPSYARSPGIGP